MVSLRLSLLSAYVSIAASAALGGVTAEQEPILFQQPSRSIRSVSVDLFAELEELARLVDISYCVGATSLGITKPFHCLSRCSDFPAFELVTTWNTGLLLSDSCGYVALDHGKKRIIVAFRGTYSIANTIVDLSTIPQQYVPYPDSEDEDEEDEKIGEEVAWEEIEGVGFHVKREAVTEHRVSSKCQNCTVHMGFHTAWLHTRDRILPDLQEQLLTYPDYALHLVGHSLGGAVAALAGLDLQARDWDPIVTTFGEPRLGNAALVTFIDEAFNLTQPNDVDIKMKYRRLTHVDDPVPLLPLTEWGYDMHAGEIFISKSALSPDIGDLEHCEGDNDRECIAGQDSTTASLSDGTMRTAKRDLLESVKNEIEDVRTESWGIPSRYKLWQLFFAHRDYFWRLGWCMPTAGPLDRKEMFGDQEG